MRLCVWEHGMSEMSQFQEKDSQTVDRTLWWQLGSVHGSDKYSGHSPWRVYCTVPGTSKHSPPRCLLQLPISELARAPCFTLLWKRDRPGGFWVGGVRATRAEGFSFIHSLVQLQIKWNELTHHYTVILNLGVDKNTCTLITPHRCRHIQYLSCCGFLSL